MSPDSFDFETQNREPNEAQPANQEASVWSTKLLVPAILVLLVSVLSFWWFTSPPAVFPINSTITIQKGANVTEIVNAFAEAGYVRSSDALHAVLALFHDATDIKAGVYVFAAPVSVFGVAHIISEVGPREPLQSITFPEGTTVAQYTDIASEKLPEFDTTEFLALAQSKEGYLFPDTYFVPTTFTVVQLYELLTDTFQAKLAPLQNDIAASALSLHEIITLASIIEREANSPESMKWVSGVLHNRLDMGMPLQADASIEYVLDTPLNELPPGQLAIELKENNSPYNTYLYPGLPPTPIGNPGLTAITAVLQPIESDYLFYLTDEEGNFHYAHTLEEHNLNVVRYLR